MEEEYVRYVFVLDKDFDAGNGIVLPANSHLGHFTQERGDEIIAGNVLRYVSRVSFPEPMDIPVREYIRIYVSKTTNTLYEY